MGTGSSDRQGVVYLVGAGPGNPGLITLRGVECLQRADVVLYDYLVNPRIVRHARRGAELICLGQHGRTRLWSQDEINARLVESARQGQTVVRLKGGDPAVFARGAEEVEVLVQHGIAYEMVPGITAALAAGSYAGVPVTHRHLSSAVALVTGQEKPGKERPAVDYEALARFPGTLVFYMGVTTAGQWTSSLIAAGKPADTPALIVRRCSLPDQLSIACRLGEVAGRLASDPPLRPPAIVIVGPAVDLAPTFSWFDKRPLFGRTVMVTRPEEQTERVVSQLEELGAEVLVQPAIEITEPTDWTAVNTALDRLDQFDWLVFSSANGVGYLLERLLASGRDLRALGGLKLAVIGPGTARALAGYHLQADLQPPEYRAESLAATLAAHAPGKRFLLARASRGRQVLAEQLLAAGGQVEQVVVYRSLDVPRPDPEVARRLHARAIDFVTVTSSAIARSLAALFGDDLNHTRLISISPLTSDTLRQLGYQPAAEAACYTLDGVVQAVVDASGRLRSPLENG